MDATNTPVPIRRNEATEVDDETLKRARGLADGTLTAKLVSGPEGHLTLTYVPVRRSA